MPSFDARVFEEIRIQVREEVGGWNDYLRALIYAEQDSVPPGMMVMTPEEEAKFAEEMTVLAMKQPNGPGQQVIEDPAVQERLAETEAAARAAAGSPPPAPATGGV